MKESLKEFIKEVTDLSGVYQFLDENKKALYVGKAKNLKKRLLNYTQENRLNARIKRMVSLANSIEIITTSSEVEALLLECNLIKKLMPRYNILLRDDKTFPYIEVSNEDFGKIAKHRGKKIKNNSYFGPFASGYDVDQTIDILKKSFLLRSCSDGEFKSRKKPCLEYQIKRCSAPCVNLISQEEYKKLINKAVDFLQGNNSKIQEELAIEMQNLSANFEFEKAAVIRDRLKAMASIQKKQNINILEIGNSDVIILVRKNNLACIYLSIYRSGYNYGSKAYFINVNEDNLDQEIIANFISQFYLEETAPTNLVISIDIELEEKLLLEQFLSKNSHNKVSIQTPQKGWKLKLIEDQTQFAKNELQQKINQNMNNKEVLIGVKNLFNLPKIPEKIEVYDNSHISGNNAIGAMICAGLEGFIKSGYRKFNIKNDEKINSEKCEDDFAMMRQVLSRRFKRLKEENLTFPDLVIIDGGKGQLSQAFEVFKEMNIVDKVALLAISKGPKRNAGEEQFHQIGKESFSLPKNDPIMYYLQNLRDEAHRFAITTHRSKRAKSLTKSALDNIEDIGPMRKKLLLNHFGSIAGIKNAAIEDLCKIRGIGKELAEKIKDSL